MPCCHANKKYPQQSPMQLKGFVSPLHLSYLHDQNATHGESACHRTLEREKNETAALHQPNKGRFPLTLLLDKFWKNLSLRLLKATHATDHGTFQLIAYQTAILKFLHLKCSLEKKS